MQRLVSLAFAATAAVAASLPSQSYEQIRVRSGNGSPGAPDSEIRYISGSSRSALRSSAFVQQDFDDACNGNQAVVINDSVVSARWRCRQLPQDPLAQWIGVNASASPRSTLFCQPFDVQSCDVQWASIKFTFCADDQLGDGSGGPNIDGVYLNGQPIPGFNGGTHGSSTTWVNSNIASMLNPSSTNSLHVYVRDTAANVSGVMYTCSITVKPCVPIQTIALRSGNSTPSTQDPDITYLPGSGGIPLRSNPFDQTDFDDACNGSQVWVVDSAVVTSRWACRQLPNDPLAQWVASGASGTTARSMLTCQEFELDCDPCAATLEFTFCADDQLGDGAGGPNPEGLYLNGIAVPGSSGGTHGTSTTWTFAVGSLLQQGTNHLQVYQRDTARQVHGVMYSAKLRVFSRRPPDEVIALESGNGGINMITTTSCGTGLPAFTAASFAAACAGPPAVNINPSVVTSRWTCRQLPASPRASWVGADSSGTPRSLLLCQSFNVDTCYIRSAQLDFTFCADDRLGDPGGSPNNGVYLNGQPVAGFAGGGHSSATTWSASVGSLLQPGPNTLHVYVRDTACAVSGVIYAAQVHVSACTPPPLVAIGSGCGTRIPVLHLADPPLVTAAPMQSCLLLSSATPAAPAALLLGATAMSIPFLGCQLEVVPSVVVPALTDASGNATFGLAIPPDPTLVGLHLFTQGVVADAATPAGIAMTAGADISIAN
ncbi:MAG: hypothetical protein AAF628_14725 [Planctomycetota bacterium]